MGQMVKFRSNGSETGGYLATPKEKGPGVVVIQEWWGLVPHCRSVVDRFAGEGFTAIAPDLWHGVSTAEPDEAQKLLMNMKLDQAAKDLSGAFNYLRDSASIEPQKIGCVGFCMGGALSLFLSTIADIDAVVSFYGIPQPDPDYGAIKGPVLGHFAEHDGWASPEAVAELSKKLESAGKEFDFFSYPGTEHAFFNDDRPEVYNRDAAKLAWDRTIDFFNKNLKM